MSQVSDAASVQRILLATDGSEYSEGAVRVAIDAAAKCASQLIAFAMVISNPEAEAIAPDFVAKGERKAHDVLSAVEAKARSQGVAVESIVRHGQDPAQKIVKQAEKQNADLIIMGRRGISGLARMMVDEATVKVCGHATSSVMVVPRSGHLPKKRILLATDGSVYSERATPVVDRFARLCGLPVTVVSVTLPRHDDARRSQAAEAAESVRATLAERGIEAEAVVVDAERPELGIISTANDRGADLIVVGSHGRTGLLEKVLIGSVSERVLSSASCPVLVVKAAPAS